MSKWFQRVIRCRLRHGRHICRWSSRSRRGPLRDHFRVAFAVAFDRRCLAIRGRFGFDIVRAVVFPFLFVAVGVFFARAVTGGVVAVFGLVFVGVRDG